MLNKDSSVDENIANFKTKVFGGHFTCYLNVDREYKRAVLLLISRFVKKWRNRLGYKQYVSSI